MTITHHLDDATLVAFGAGTLNAGLSLVVGAHLEMCAACRKAALLANEIGGGLMDCGDAAALSSSSKAAVMHRIQTATLHRLPVARPKPNEVPNTLHNVLGTTDLDSLKWRRAGPGVMMFKPAQQNAQEGFFGLLRIKPGYKMPDHGHGGMELTLILRGAYHDQIGHFARGDIADLDESIVHTPVAADGEECICLVANDASTRFRSWPARVVQRFIGI